MCECYNCEDVQFDGVEWRLTGPSHTFSTMLSFVALNNIVHSEKSAVWIVNTLFDILNIKCQLVKFLRLNTSV